MDGFYLYSVFEENIVPTDVIADVPGDGQVGDSVESYYSGVGVVDRNTVDVTTIKNYKEIYKRNCI